MMQVVWWYFASNPQPDVCIIKIKRKKGKKRKGEEEVY
jgi:hypothetical protein